MGRLIEFQPGPTERLTISVGDVLLVGAAGVVVQSGAEAVEVVGPLLPGVVGDNGRVLAPAGAPNTLLIVARKVGKAVLAFKTGAPYRSVETATLDLDIVA